MWTTNMWGCGGGMFGMGFIWWVLLVAGIVWIGRWRLGARGPGPAEEDRALSILRERYARGEIDKAEFDARRRDLGSA